MYVVGSVRALFVVVLPRSLPFYSGLEGADPCSSYSSRLLSRRVGPL